MIEIYAGLVRDSRVRKSVLKIILAEFDSTREMMALVFGSTLEKRRPRMLKTLALRDSGLRALHVHQTKLLAEWRCAESASKSRLLPEVLLSINAIASGLRTTG
jgi:phosphoenolpyruvate carboxylase